MRTEVALERSVVAFEAQEFRAVLSVVAPHEQGDQRAPLNLVAVLDKSGSMQGSVGGAVQRDFLMTSLDF